jgi:hypothetical protein
MVDAFLLRQFPGRTLEELDQMDWLRYNRALHANILLDAEDVRKQHAAGRLKAKDISATKWARIRDNDEVLNKYFGDR